MSLILNGDLDPKYPLGKVGHLDFTVLSSVYVVTLILLLSHMKTPS